MPDEGGSIVEILFVWFALVFMIAAVAQSKGRPWWLWALVAFLFTPIVGAAVLFMPAIRAPRVEDEDAPRRRRRVRERDEAERQLDAVNCPVCQMLVQPVIKASNAACPRCGLVLM